MTKETFINNNTFSGCLHSKGVVLHVHLGLRGSMLYTSCQGEVETVSAWRLGAEKGSKYCEQPSMGKAGAQLGGVISHHLGGRYRSIFPRGPR